MCNKNDFKIFFSLILITFLLESCSVNKSSKTKNLKSANETSVENYFSSYTINDEKFGTKTSVKVSDEFRIIETNGLPNHKTGVFPGPGNPNAISEQNIFYKLPVNPKYTGKPKWARVPGVALNGVKFEPETAERFICETGEVYKVEAFQDLINLGLDSNNAHVQPNGEYHYHGLPIELIFMLDKGDDLIHIGFANDGFPIYYSKSNAYKPSYKVKDDLRSGEICTYKTRRNTITKELDNTKPDGIFVSDWEYIKGLGDLDECNGTYINGNYVYFVTFSYPYVGRCLMGENTEKKTNRF